jgi:enoyl-CoA hydratase/carnithine racemase
LEDGIAILRLDHPENRNAFGGDNIIDQLVSAIDQLGRDHTVKVAIVTGNGKAFCPGGNLASLAKAGDNARKNPDAVRLQYNDGIQRTPLAFERLGVPTIAAVNGPAIGAGCDLACMCDIRIASQSAKFAVSFIKLGIVPEDGGASLLAKVVGRARAYELSFTGDTIDAAEALRIGLVTHLVPDDELMRAALSLAGRIARNPASTLRMTKRLIREGVHSRLDTILQMSTPLQALSHHTQEHEHLVADMRAQQAAKTRSQVS